MDQSRVPCALGIVRDPTGRANKFTFIPGDYLGTGGPYRLFLKTGHIQFKLSQPYYVGLNEWWEKQPRLETAKNRDSRRLLAL
jgi:hypothetical protein